MSKIKCIIEMDEEDFKSIEYSTLLYHLNATPIAESEDCVSREAVLAIAGDSCLDLDSYEDTKEFCDVIKDLPPVLPKREQGEWVEVHPLQEDDGGAYMCSKCRCGHPCIDPDYWKYCPNCGAEMR